MSAPSPEDMAKWPELRLQDPETRGPVVLGLTVSTVVLMALFIVARFYGRGVLTSGLGLDDWIMGVAAVFAVGVSTVALVSLNYGLGLHIWEQRLEWSEPYNMMAFASNLLFPLSTGLTKVSVCFTYLRLFPSRTNKIICHALIAFVGLYTMTCLLLVLFQCRPISGYWKASITQDCINIHPTLVSIATLNSISDFLVFLWPAKQLWSVQLPRKQRVGLILMFAIGCTVCGAGICRIYYLEVYFGSYDLLWNAAHIYAVMAVEMNAGIICGCIAGVKSVVAVMFPRVFGTASTRTCRPSETRPQISPLQHPLGVSETPMFNSTTFETIDLEAPMAPKDSECNHAWASSSRHVDAEVPQNSIAVDRRVVISRHPSVVETGLPRIMEELKGSQRHID